MNHPSGRPGHRPRFGNRRSCSSVPAGAAMLPAFRSRPRARRQRSVRCGGIDSTSRSGDRSRRPGRALSDPGNPWPLFRTRDQTLWAPAKPEMPICAQAGLHGADVRYCGSESIDRRRDGQCCASTGCPRRRPTRCYTTGRPPGVMAARTLARLRIHRSREASYWTSRHLGRRPCAPGSSWRTSRRTCTSCQHRASPGLFGTCSTTSWRRQTGWHTSSRPVPHLRMTPITTLTTRRPTSSARTTPRSALHSTRSNSRGRWTSGSNCHSGELKGAHLLNILIDDEFLHGLAPCQGHRPIDERG